MSEKQLVKAEIIQPVADTTPSGLLSIVINQGADIEKIKALMDLQERHEQNIAKRLYTEAMASFKSDPPLIVKDNQVSFGQTSYSHASLGQVTAKINSALSNHGLSAGWKTEQDERGITVTCIITHEAGHSESTSLSSPPDNSGGKNAIQGIGSAVSYLSRYTILALTGLSTSENDDDGAASGYSKGEIKTLSISQEKFISGIDFFMKTEQTPEALDKWFESKADSFLLLSVDEKEQVKVHLAEIFEWLDKNGKFANKSEDKLEINI